MRKIFAFLTILWISIGTAACDVVNIPQMISLPKIDLGLGFGSAKPISGSGDVIKENRTLRDIKEIVLGGAGNLIIVQGDKEGLQIEAEDNLIQFFKIIVSQGKLSIDTNSGASISPTEPINFYLNVKDLTAITVDGSGSIQSENLRADQFSITLNGSGNVKIPKFKAQSLVVKIPGSGDIRLGGRVNDQDINITGSGNYFAKGLISITSRVKVSGSGSTEILANDSLDVNIKGSGVVRYMGNPQLTKYISGSGGVEKIQK